MLADLGGAGVYAASTLIVLLSLVPFFASFEGRRPQAREVVIVAVLCALAVVSRAAFMFVPSFKPMVGIVMLAGVAFGPQTGFLTGALSAVVSNCLFGHGPWTPWQMVAYGAGGAIAGLLAKAGVLPRDSWGFKRAVLAAVIGFAVVVGVVGPMLDTCSLFMFSSQLTLSMAVAIYAAGFPFNVVHGIAVALTLLLAGNPLLRRLHRVRVKYGLMELGSRPLSSSISEDQCA